MIKSPEFELNPFCSWLAFATVEVYPTSSSYALLLGVPFKSAVPPFVLKNFDVLSGLLPGIFDKSILVNVPDSWSTITSCRILSLYLLSLE